jgi:transposase
VKDIPAFGKLTSLILRKRRYRCPFCGKRFFENNLFLPKYHHMTNRLAAYTISKLSDVRSFTNVAREVNRSVSTILRIFDCINYGKPQQLPEVVSINEFNGNTSGEKYQCMLTEPVVTESLIFFPLDTATS